MKDRGVERGVHRPVVGGALALPWLEAGGAEPLDLLGAVDVGGVELPRVAVLPADVEPHLGVVVAQAVPWAAAG